MALENLVATAWPDSDEDPRSGLGGLLAAQALLKAMDPGWEAQAAAGYLAGLAAGDEPALCRALARIQSSSWDAARPLAERAAQALRLALEPDPDDGGAAG